MFVTISWANAWDTKTFTGRDAVARNGHATASEDGPAPHNNAKTLSSRQQDAHKRCMVSLTLHNLDSLRATRIALNHAATSVVTNGYTDPRNKENGRRKMKAFLGPTTTTDTGLNYLLRWHDQEGDDTGYALIMKHPF